MRVSLVRLRASVRADSAVALVRFLGKATDEGSLPAQVGLAYCSERGIGVPTDVGEAVHLYHAAWARGSRDAYRALQRIYDGLRPAEKEFTIDRQSLENIN